jgi:hypothetical protein
VSRRRADCVRWHVRVGVEGDVEDEVSGDGGFRV